MPIIVTLWPRSTIFEDYHDLQGLDEIQARHIGIFHLIKLLARQYS